MTITITRKHIFTTVISLAVVATVSASVYFFLQYRHSQALLKNPAEAAKTANAEVITAVSRIVDVPAGEDPTVANVTDIEKLRNQPFFARAENGDKVIFFPTSKIAILYRPATGKIIEMSAVSVGGTPEVAGAATTPGPSVPVQPNPTATPAPKPFRVAIYNGTETPRLANNLEKIVLEKLPLATVVLKANAKKTDYANSLVIDLSDVKFTEAKAISSLISGEMTTLPEGEIKPDADILVIIGSNWKP